MKQPAASPSIAPVAPSALDLRASPLAGWVLALFLTAGLLSCLWLMLKGPVSFLPQHVDRDMLLHGELTRRFAKQLQEAPLARQAAELERGGSWLLLGDLGPRVRQGCPGWLFLSDELRLYPNAQANAASKVRDVLELQRRLQERGIELLVAVVPDKSRIAADQLCGLPRAPALQMRTSAWLDPLRQAGVRTLDLTPALAPLGSDAFLRTDTHWSESGAQAAAQAIAQTVRAMPVQPTPAAAFDLEQTAPAPQPGDLVRLAGIDWLPQRLQPPRQWVAASRISQRQATPSAAEQSLDDLLGDANLPNSVLIGTSFSRHSNFAGFLQLALGAPLGNFAKDGGEFAGAANAYFASPAFKQTPPRLIVWEIPERDLQAPAAQQLQLP